MNTTTQPITETLETLRSVNKDIKDLKSRLFGGIKEDSLVLLNYRILMEALETRKHAIDTLDQLFKNISLDDLGLEIN